MEGVIVEQLENFVGEFPWLGPEEEEIQYSAGLWDVPWETQRLFWIYVNDVVGNAMVVGSEVEFVDFDQVRVEGYHPGVVHIIHDWPVSIVLDIG